MKRYVIIRHWDDNAELASHMLYRTKEMAINSLIGEGNFAICMVEFGLTKAQYIERTQLKTESVQAFLERGGTITKCKPPGERPARPFVNPRDEFEGIE